MLWSDDSSIDLDPNVIELLANSSRDTKEDVSPTYARAFILEFSRRAKKVKIDEELNWGEVDQMVDDALESAQTVLGRNAEETTWSRIRDEYSCSKGMSGKVLMHIKGIVDSITADASVKIDSEKQELENLESLLEELGGKTGDRVDTGGLLQDVHRGYIMQTHGSMESILQRVQSLSKFLEGSIEILQNP